MKIAHDTTCNFICQNTSQICQFIISLAYITIALLSLNEWHFNMYATYHYYLCVYHRLLRIWLAAANLVFGIWIPFCGSSCLISTCLTMRKIWKKLSKGNETLILILKSQMIRHKWIKYLHLWADCMKRIKSRKSRKVRKKC